MYCGQVGCEPQLDKIYQDGSGCTRRDETWLDKRSAALLDQCKGSLRLVGEQILIHKKKVILFTGGGFLFFIKKKKNLIGYKE